MLAFVLILVLITLGLIFCTANIVAENVSHDIRSTNILINANITLGLKVRLDQCGKKNTK